MEERTKTLIQEAYRRRALCGLFVDLQGIEYRAAERSRDLGHGTGQLRLDVFNSCARLYAGLQTHEVESIWVVGAHCKPEIRTVGAFREALLPGHQKEELDFAVVTPRDNETTCIRPKPDGFQGMALSQYMFRNHRNVPLIAGLKAYGCVTETIWGGLGSYAVDDIVVVSDGIDLTIPVESFCQDFESVRCHHATIDEILECLSPAGHG